MLLYYSPQGIQCMSLKSTVIVKGGGGSIDSEEFRLHARIGMELILCQKYYVSFQFCCQHSVFSSSVFSPAPSFHCQHSVFSSTNVFVDQLKSCMKTCSTATDEDNKSTITQTLTIFGSLKQWEITTNSEYNMQICHAPWCRLNHKFMPIIPALFSILSDP